MGFFALYSVMTGAPIAGKNEKFKGITHTCSHTH